jgi:UDP-N-acetylglucosamine 2-epimerase (non-hydrolysing)
MPEEINRVLVDNLSDLLFVTEESGMRNLSREGIPESRVHLVGNVMIDTLQRHLEKARLSDVRQRFNLPATYGVVTLHRPSNVDSAETLRPLLAALHEIAKTIPLVFPIHPRTLKNVEAFGLTHLLGGSSHPGQTDTNLQGSAPKTPPSRTCLIPPLGYLDFLHLIEKATLVITDSGGIQEETTCLKIPCMTLRENTERPVTVTVGSNYLVGTKPEDILATAAAILTGPPKPAAIPIMWDGQSGKRIIEIIWQEYSIPAKAGDEADS